MGRDKSRKVMNIVINICMGDHSCILIFSNVDFTSRYNNSYLLLNDILFTINYFDYLI